MIKSWMVIGGVAFLVALANNILLTSDDIRWFNRLTRPRWLTFERAIPLIWIIVFIAGAWSAILVWEAETRNIPNLGINGILPISRISDFVLYPGHV